MPAQKANSQQRELDAWRNAIVPGIFNARTKGKLSATRIGQQQFISLDICKRSDEIFNKLRRFLCSLLHLGKFGAGLLKCR